MLPAFKQEDSEGTSKLVPKLQPGGEFLVSNLLVELVAQIQNLMDIEGQQV